MQRSPEILTEIQDLAPALAAPGLHQNLYTVPVGFFNGLAQAILEKVRALDAAGPAEEIAILSPLLAGLSRKSPYQAPENYFPGLAGKLASQAGEGSEEKTNAAPVISMPHTRPVRRWLAAAAIVAGILFTSVLLVRQRTTANDDPNTAITKVSDQEISNFIQDADGSEAQAAEVPANMTASADFNDNDISDLLSNVSDQELESYPADPNPAPTVN